MTDLEELGADVSSITEEKQAPVKKITTATTATKMPPSDSQASGLTSTEKRLRALKKKLQQIDNLKDKRGRGVELEKTQVWGIFLQTNAIKSK